MEYTQWEVWMSGKQKTKKCLNPCCNGIYSMSAFNFYVLLSSLNPCCNGIYSMRNEWKTKLKSLSCLNPCCNGIYSMSRYGKEKRSNWAVVLILVVMEYTQWVFISLFSIIAQFVLILVVMEYTQWECEYSSSRELYCLNPCCNGIYSMSMVWECWCICY